jgi:hypothetical protein
VLESIEAFGCAVVGAVLEPRWMIGAGNDTGTRTTGLTCGELVLEVKFGFKGVIDEPELEVGPEARMVPPALLSPLVPVLPPRVPSPDPPPLNGDDEVGAKMDPPPKDCEKFPPPKGCENTPLLKIIWIWLTPAIVPNSTLIAEKLAVVKLKITGEAEN